MSDEYNDQIHEYLRGVTGIVEANNFEKMCLWQANHEHREWKENGQGFLPTVAWLDRRPVAISLFTAVVSGSKLLFWYPTSEVVDYIQIEKWFEENLPDTARRSNGYINRTDAMNFHNIFPMKEAS